jgi:hypothetical protein
MKVELIGAIDTRGEIGENLSNVLMEKPAGKGSLGNPRRRWDDNI